MSDPPPFTPTINGTYPDAQLCSPPERKELYDAYRSAVSTAYLLQKVLDIPFEKRAVFTRKEREAAGL